MLRCTTVFPAVDGSNHGKRIERLSVDYSVDCDDALYSAHYVAALVLLAVAAALPAVVIIRVRALSDDSDRLRDIIGISHRVAAELGVDPDNAQEAITHLLTGREFSFMTAGLGSEYLWWEAVARRRPSASLHGVRDGQRELTSLRTCFQDMLRKLSIVGAGTLLPTLVGAADPIMRLFLVLVVALGWLVVQVRLQPYRLQEVRSLSAGHPALPASAAHIPRGHACFRIICSRPCATSSSLWCARASWRTSTSSQWMMVWPRAGTRRSLR